MHDHAPGFDPAGLNDVRDRMQRETARRWRSTARDVARAVVADDVLGLGPKAAQAAQPAADKVALFGRWLNERLMVGVVGHDAGWIGPHVYAASARARRAALGDAQVNLAFMVPTAARSAPACHAASATMLATVCEETSRRAQAGLVEALQRRAKPLDAARLLRRVLADGQRRSSMLAEHAVTMAYSQGVLDSLEDAGVRYVGTISERAARASRRVADGLPQAAGVMFTTPDGRALFMRRTDGEGWAFPGGGLEWPESLEVTAIREAHEECGHAPSGPLTRVWRSNGHGVDYTTFRLDVPAPFDPALNHEHDAAVWAPISDPPQPLHPGVAEMLASEPDWIEDYNPDEARDKVGRWTAGNGASISPSGVRGGAAQFYSPNVGHDVNFDQARQQMAGARQAATLRAAAEIDTALGLHDTSTRSIVGAWSDGAENSIVSTMQGATWDQVRTAAAMKGYVGDQKAVLAFQQDDSGDALLYQFGAKGSLKEIHEKLLAAGVNFHSLAPTADGADVFVADLDGSAHNAVQKAVEAFDANATYQRGRAEFIGADGEAGSDRETRDAARSAYERVIGQSQVPGAAQAWASNRDRWTGAIDGAEFGGAGGSGGSASLRQAQETASRVANGEAPLAGLPQKPISFSDGSSYVPGPSAHIRDVAASYMASAGLPYSPPTQYVKVDRARAKRLADAFDAMPNAPDDPAVKASYAALANEVIGQWHALRDSGLKVEWIKPGQADPYAANPRLAAKDVAENNHWWGFPTDLGYGSGAAVSRANNPMLAKVGEIVDGRQVVLNDLFRVVHDYFGHFKEGVGFRAEGEDNAWRSHAAMFSRAALPAMTAETRGQNSWVNFGPYGETNRRASAADTHYAPQKIGVMPDWAFDDIAAGRKMHDSVASWLADAARASPQPQHPRSGRFVPQNVYAREVSRHPLTGRFRRQSADPREQARAERANRGFRSTGPVDVLTAEDNRVCDVCDAISHGGPYTINTARSLIPAHPNCRCVFVAAGSMDLGDDFNRDQPRDNVGRWTAGGGGQQARKGRSIEEIAASMGLGASIQRAAAAISAGGSALPKAPPRAPLPEETAPAPVAPRPSVIPSGSFPPPEWANGVKLYHGTSSALESTILKEGLRPHAGPGGDAWAEENGMSLSNHAMDRGRDVSVYMTDRPDIASQFARWGAQMTSSKPVMFSVDLPPSAVATLKPDEYFAPGKPALARHAVRYEGSIPPEWIKKFPYPGMQDSGDVGKTVYVVIFANDKAGIADFDPSQPRDKDGKWTPLQGSQGHPALISTRKVTSVKEAPLVAGQYQRIDIDAMKQTPDLFDTNMRLFKNGVFYPGMRPDELKGSASDIANAVRDRMASNLEFLAKTVPAEEAEKWKGWYDGAHKLADEWAKKYDIDIASSSAVLAALSPQNEWEGNVYQARAVMDAMKNKQGMKWDDAMSATSKRIWKDENATVAKEIEGKSLGDLAGDDPRSLLKQAVWIRTEDEAHSDHTYRHVNPDGSLGGLMKNENGSNAKPRWMNNGNIVNAIASFKSGGDQKIISDAMGSRHKVRSFYNNILDPHSANGDVTIDTHAVGAAWLTPSSGKDVSVAQALASSMATKDQPEGYQGSGSSAKTGVTGTYGVYADAYRQAAEALKMEPRQLQSVTWEAKQRLFSKKITGTKIKAAVDAVWKKFRSGDISLRQAQDGVVKVAKEIVQ